MYTLAWKYQTPRHADDPQRPHFEVEFEPCHINQCDTLQ